MHLKREQYQRALRDPAYDMMGRAQARAESLMRDFKDMLNQSIDRLDDLLTSLRGEGREAVAAGPFHHQSWTTGQTRTPRNAAARMTLMRR